MKLSTLFLRAAKRVARYEADDDPTHASCCDAIAMDSVNGGDLESAHFAYKRFAELFGQPQRPVYWFGKTYVYPHMTPRNYEKKWAETKANQQARIYALLFMWTMYRA